MSFPIWNTWQKRTTCSECLVLWFSRTYPADISFIFDIKTLVNRRIDFLALNFVTIMEGPSDIVLLYINLLGVDTIEVSRISLNCIWSLHLPADVYISLMFYRHLCLYIAQLLNNWKIPMVTIYCFSLSDCSNPLWITHCCSNDIISIIKSITLVNAHDLEHYSAWAVLQTIWKQRYSFPGGVSFWPGLWVIFLCWHFSESDSNKIWTLGALTP